MTYVEKVNLATIIIEVTIITILLIYSIVILLFAGLANF